VPLDIAGWARLDRKGNKFLALSIKPKEQRTARSGQQPTRTNPNAGRSRNDDGEAGMDDDTPFDDGRSDEERW
jgi:hypothetical protein